MEVDFALGQQKPLVAYGKIAHSSAVLFTIASFFFCVWVWPSLLKDEPTILGTFGVFVTVLGVLATFIEVLRTKAAAKIAAEAAVAAAAQIKIFYGIKDATECQTLIEGALVQIEEEGTLPASTIGRIVKMYASEFSTACLDEKSAQRQRISVLNSFGFIQGRSKADRTLNSMKLKCVLSEMMADLSTAVTRRFGQESSK